MNTPILVAACLLSCTAFAAAPPQRVSGVVLNEVTGAPVANARVSLSLTRANSPNTISMTGPDGRFVFNNVVPGKYLLSAQRRGYVSTQYGQGRMAAAVAVIVAPGEKTEGLVHRLPPVAAIGGRVTDEVGEPVSHALVQLLSSTVADGHRRVYSWAYQWTDDLGEYRFPGLRSGSYYVCVSGQPWAGDRQRSAAFYPRCYGSSGDPASAALITLKTGQDFPADFTLVPARGATLTITAPKPDRFVLSLVVPAIGGSDWFIRTTQSYGQPLHNVAPGTYWILGRKQTGEPLYRRQRIEVAGVDLAVTLVPDEPLIVDAQARIQGKLPPGGPPVFYLRNDDSQGGLTREMGPSGAFRFDNLTPARYTLGISQLRDIYIDRLTAEGAPVEGRTLDLREAASPVRISLTLRTDGGRVDGFVRRDKQPIPGALVILAPLEDSKDPSDYRLYVSDSDGSFDFTNIRPGRYHLFATTLPELEYANPAALRPFRKSATLLTIDPNSRQTSDLQLPASVE